MFTQLTKNKTNIRRKSNQKPSAKIMCSGLLKLKEFILVKNRNCLASVVWQVIKYESKIIVF